MADKHYQLGIGAQKHIAELLVLEPRLRTDNVGPGIYPRLEFKKRGNSKQSFS